MLGFVQLLASAEPQLSATSQFAEPPQMWGSANVFAHNWGSANAHI